MKNIRYNIPIFIIGVIIITFSLFAKNVYAFSCTSNGLSIGGNGTYVIPIDITLNKTSTDILLSDLSTYTICAGYLGYAGPSGPAANDALRTYGSSSFSAQLTTLGFTGYAILPTGKFNFPLPTGQCVWPDGACSYDSSTTGTTRPIYIKIGMMRNSATATTGTTVPAGTEIARFTLEQRGTVGGAAPTWGNGIKTWVFTLKSPLIIPAYTCSINNANQTVVLPAVNKVDVINNGAGRYPLATPFNISLSCDPQTTVSAQFDGTTLPGTQNVLANTSPGNTSIGIQMTYNGTPVVLGQKFQAISSATAQQLLNFQSYYYYNGGNLNSGPINAVSTFTFSYN